MDPDRSSVRHREAPGEQRSHPIAGPHLVRGGFRYLPVYIALLVLIVVAAIWAPATLSSVALRAIAPYGAVLGIAALGQMQVVMTGGIDLSVPGTMSLAAVIMVGVGDGSNENIGIAVATAIAVAALIGLVNGLLIGGLNERTHHHPCGRSDWPAS
jgi:ribose/xylose/arabinose/galactoside ABC-type transport system permease subunit